MFNILLLEANVFKNLNAQKKKKFYCKIVFIKLNYLQIFSYCFSKHSLQFFFASRYGSSILRINHS